MASETAGPSHARWRSRAVTAILFVAAVVAIRAWQQRDMASGAAPPLQGMTLAGRHYELGARPGHPVLVHFWATWCPICRTELGSITSIAGRADVITVAMQSGTPQEVARYLRAQGADFPVLNDPDGRLAQAWGVHAVPASFVIGPDGDIRFVEVGLPH
jgi:peroxiredoxin